MEEVEKIELRSEKVRRIIGEIPPSIVRYGIFAITIIVTALLAGAYFIPYPQTINGRAAALDSKTVMVDVPYKYANTIHIGMKANIEFQGFDSEDWGYIVGMVGKISRQPETRNHTNYFTVTMSVKSGKYKVIRGMVGNATVLVTNESILERLLSKLLGT